MLYILGSASPRRKMILSDYFPQLQIVHPSIDETPVTGESPEIFAQRIAMEKMQSITEQIGLCKGYVAVTADTIVAIDGKILGKPESFSSARDMLSLLSGKEHRVVTGVALSLNRNDTLREFAAIESTSVFFKKLTDEIINNYLKKVEYLDKAGSYAVQEHGDMLIESVKGSLTNVIGFPLRLFFSILAQNNEMELLL